MSCRSALLIVLKAPIF